MDYQESFGLARQLGDLVQAVEDKVLPLDPAKAFELVDAFLTTDRKTVERVDDSSGVVSDAYRGHLKSLAALAAEHGRPRIEMLCYRELLSCILREARSKAYVHAARYYRRLEELDRVTDDYGELGDHQAFLGGLRERHGRKYSFWRRVDE